MEKFLSLSHVAHSFHLDLIYCTHVLKLKHTQSTLHTMLHVLYPAVDNNYPKKVTPDLGFVYYDLPRSKERILRTKLFYSLCVATNFGKHQRLSIHHHQFHAIICCNLSVLGIEDERHTLTVCTSARRIAHRCSTAG